MGVAFASALSEHPLAVHAVGEVAGQVLEAMGPGADLALLFVTPPHAGMLEDAAATVRSVLGLTTLVGCAAESVVGTGREVEQGPAVCLWAGRTGPVTPVLLEAGEGPGGLAGWPEEMSGQAGAAVLIGDPYSLPADALFAGLATARPGLAVIGGMASAGLGPGGNRLVLDDQLRTAGAVGVVFGAATRMSAVVSQGCRPIGHPLVVTRAEGNVLHELAGQPPLQRLVALAQSLDEREVALINSGGLHLGRVIDEHQADFERGDFLIRNVLGSDRQTGAIAVNDVVETGTTVQFHLRDAQAADEDLRSLLADRRAAAALLFTCNGRGRRLFKGPDHDAGVLAEALGPVPTAGFFAAGEFGPVGGRNFVHGFTASIALFEGLEGRAEAPPGHPPTGLGPARAG